MKNKSIIIMTILSLVLVVGCCYHQQYTMNCNYDMPVSECPAMVTNSNGKDAELLTKGINPIIYKGSIYYQKLDFPEDGEEYYCKSLGIHKMSLSGKNDVCINDSEYISQFTIYNSNIYYIDVDYTGNRDYYEEYYSLKSMDMNGDSQKTIFEGEKDSIINGLVAYSDGYESADENERAPYNMAKYFCKLDGKDRVLLKGYVRT